MSGVARGRTLVRVPGDFPFLGRVVWLTAEQGGRSSGPPPPSDSLDYAQTAFVPPHSFESGLASFVLRGFEAGAWVSPAQGRWLVVEAEGAFQVEPGSIVVCTEGARVVAYFHVERVIGVEPAPQRGGPAPATRGDG